jgi:hypothetical protein
MKGLEKKKEKTDEQTKKGEEKTLKRDRKERGGRLRELDEEGERVNTDREKALRYKRR